MAPYPYGTPPAWWGKGRVAAGQAAQDAIALSVRVGDRMRALVGKKGELSDLRNQLHRLFVDSAERAEAVRLLELAVWNKRGKNDDNRTTLSAFE
jgi:hypothetical protein